MPTVASWAKPLIRYTGACLVPHPCIARRIVKILTTTDGLPVVSAAPAMLMQALVRESCALAHGAASVQWLPCWSLTAWPMYSNVQQEVSTSLCCLLLCRA